MGEVGVGATQTTSAREHRLAWPRSVSATSQQLIGILLIGPVLNAGTALISIEPWAPPAPLPRCARCPIFRGLRRGRRRWGDGFGNGRCECRTSVSQIQVKSTQVAPRTLCGETSSDAHIRRALVTLSAPRNHSRPSRRGSSHLLSQAVTPKRVALKLPFTMV